MLILLLILVFYSKPCAPQSSSPSNASYAPYFVDCPPNALLTASPHFVIAHEESKWLRKRASASLPAWRGYLENVNITGLDVNKMMAYLSSNATRVPRMATVMSGGGLRALLTGAGVLNAMDMRNPDAVAARTGGLEQLLTYIVGMSLCAVQ